MLQQTKMTAESTCRKGSFSPFYFRCHSGRRVINERKALRFGIRSGSGRTGFALIQGRLQAVEIYCYALHEPAGPAE